LPAGYSAVRGVLMMEMWKKSTKMDPGMPRQLSWHFSFMIKGYLIGKF
jgi:hypothetical protein